MENTFTQDQVEEHEEKKETKKKNVRKKDPFTEITDKILTGQGIDPKKFDKEAIQKAREEVYNVFVEENIEKLL